MDVKNFVIFIVCLSLVLTLPMRGSGGRTGAGNLSLALGNSKLIDSSRMDECTVRMYGHEVVMPLFPEIKGAITECLVRKGFHMHLSKDDYRRNTMCMECLELVLSWHHVQRRHLANKSPSAAPTFSLDGGRSTPVASPNFKDEQEAPPVQIPLISRKHPAIHSTISSSTPTKPTPHKSGAKIPPPHEEEDTTRLIIDAVILSSIGTSLLLLCVLCCYWKFCRRRRYSMSRRDERPLLLLSLSNASGSSDASFGHVGSSNHSEKLVGQQNSGFNQSCHVLSGNVDHRATSSSEVVSNTPSLGNNDGSETRILLPLPPGRSPIPSIAPSAPSAVVPLPMPAAVPSTPSDVVPRPMPAAVPYIPSAVVPLPMPAVVPSTPSAVIPPPPAVVPPPPAVVPPPPAVAPPPPPPIKPPANKAAPPAPPAPRPPTPNQKPGAQMPPPPPKAALPPRQGNSRTKKPTSLVPCPPHRRDVDGDDDGPKTKLKPFFWDKVQANSQSNVWSQIRSGSFQFDEDMIESLFGYNNAVGKNLGEKKKESQGRDASPKLIQLLEGKKSQNLAISLKALSVKSQEVREALMEGNELPTALLQALLRMQPTTDEELKLRLYTGDLSILAPAEQFLKDLIDIPCTYKRMDALLFMSSLHEDVTIVKEAFATMEVACTELRGNRLFLKLLEAVLKTGNRMNDGTYRGGAQAFKIDTLLKLADVKGADGKTTLLHFVVKETIRSEGRRAARLARESGSITFMNNFSFGSDDMSEDILADTEDSLQAEGLKIVSGLPGELENVKKAAGIDIDATTTTVANYGRKLIETKEFLNKDMKNLEEDSGFHTSLKCFVEHAEVAITFLLGEERRIRTLVQSTTDYFHGCATKDEGLRLFVTVRDFLGMVDKICKEVKESAKKVSKPPVTKDVIKDRPPGTSPPTPDPRQLLFPVIRDRRVESSSSDEDDD
ncbi:formin-like protein 3 [Zingiber officinale]|uniref:formin-like protein 3 n=1 Tax=Zingiber officinale TaxID=94328 RepID=UPI001C4DC620|nr:formin-like protein 3 [Zingiber officinale]